MMWLARYSPHKAANLTRTAAFMRTCGLNISLTTKPIEPEYSARSKL